MRLGCVIPWKITPLYKAISNGHIDAVMMLVGHGAILHDRLLYPAATNIHMLKLLIDGYGINRDRCMVYISNMAISTHNADILRYIRPCYWDLKLNLDTIKLILDMGIDINEGFGLNGDTLLHMCIRAGERSLARYMVKNMGADASICNDIGERPTLRLIRMSKK